MPKYPRCSAEIPSEIYRTTECPSCSKPLHCCICCEFYCPSASHGCRETIDEPVWDKENANFCDHFRLSTKVASSVTSQDAKKQAARAALDKLFNF